MARLAKDMPKRISYQLPFDTTTFARQSVIDVYKTLSEAALLVLAVILLFLQNWRTMLVPATTMPVTIIGTLRPIMMTSFAFILGVVPLVIATGATASARRSLGIAVFSGMLASTCIAVLFIASFYVLLQRLLEQHATRETSHETSPETPPAA